MIVVADVETTLIQKDGSTEKMWIFGGRNVTTGEMYRFEPFRGQSERDAAAEWASGVDQWVFHNGISFDLPQIHKHIAPRLIDPAKVIDTLIISRLLHYARRGPKAYPFKPHSLAAWGHRLGVHKGDFNTFSEYSQEMVDYWENDLNTGEALYNHFLKYINDPDWAAAIRIEHDTQIELVRQQYHGFKFNTPKAEKLLSSVLGRMTTLEEELANSFPPQLKVVKTVQYRTKKDGELMASTQKALDTYPITKKTDDGNLICYDNFPFKPGSPIDRVDVLWEAGWRPHEKTKTHQKFGRLKIGMPYGKTVKSMDAEFYNNKLKHLQKYGWTVSEDNLNTLPESAPSGARKLAQWLTLEGRRSSLVEWLGQVQEDGRIHGQTQGIGAWTQRAAHKAPNTANISSVWPVKDGVKVPAKTAVESIKREYDTDMRGCWEVAEGNWLVGVDAEGIQLRILGDQIWKHFGERGYADTIVNGDKDKGTDIHNVNRRALNVNGLTRSEAKTFIYAYVLNAGLPKIASILGVTIPIANNARSSFESSIEGLSPFKSQVLPAIADQGWFTGYDGRKVVVPSLHKTLAGILQNGEAVMMKHAMRKWHKDLKSEGIRYKALTFVHDEWQTEVVGTRAEAERVKQIQIDSIRWAGKELGFRCRLDGSGSIGTDWSMTH